MTFVNPNSPAAIMFVTDSYKLAHRKQYPEGTTRVYSNYTNRGSRLKDVSHVVHFGLQAFIQNVLMDSFKPFFAATEDAVAEDYERKLLSHLGPNNVGSDHIRALHRLGYLPLRFCAVPEGTSVPLRVPSFTVENTLDDFFWLTNYIETALSAAIWQASTSATLSWRLRRLLDEHAEKTSSTLAAVDFQGHDFSFRGMSSIDTAAQSGAGHLISFLGTDSLVALDWIDYFYPGDNEPVGLSVPATEHSVMCAGGQETEQNTYERLLTLHPNGILSVVSDTWNFFSVLTKILPNLKDKIMARDGKLVIRPDSGDPADIICGTERSNPDERMWGDLHVEEKGAIELLWDIFGGIVNDKGYRELDPHIGLIYGDSITYERAQEICDRLEAKGFASTNVVFGMGSYTFQYNTRDVFGSAMKATWAKINGEGVNLLKDPKTDDGLKKSATGRLAVLSKYDGSLYRVEKATPEQEAQSLLKPVWENGQFIRKQSFANVRNTLKKSTELLKRNGGIN